MQWFLPRLGDKLLADEGLRGSEALTECYERFLGLNKRVLKVSSDTVMRDWRLARSWLLIELSGQK